MSFVTQDDATGVNPRKFEQKPPLVRLPGESTLYTVTV